MESVTRQVLVSSAVTGLNIADDRETIKPGDVKNLFIKFGTIGEDACISIDFGDGEMLYYGPDAASCTTVDCVQSPEAYMSCDYISPIDVAKLSVNVSHKYPDQGTYNIVVKGLSSMGDDRTEITVVVSGSDCTSPYVDITHRKSLFSQPLEVLRKDPFTVLGIIELNCDVTYDNIKSWRVEEVDPKTGSKIQDVEKLSKLSSVGNVQLAVPSRFLPYGLYRFIFRVEMYSGELDTGVVFATEIDTYIKVVKSPLIALMITGGMTLISRGWDSILTLEPEKYSVDPDLEDGQPQVCKTLHFQT